MKGKKTVGKTNSVPPGFLDAHRHGGNGEDVVYLALETGFLRLEYDPDGAHPLLFRVAFVAAKSKFSPAIGNLLELSLDPEGHDDTVTFIAEEGVSGVQWSGGRACWGHTYDDDSPAGEGEEIGLGAWIDRCIDEMINPPVKIIDELKKRYDPAKDIAAIRAGDEKARDRFWKKCSPATEEETEHVLELLRYAVEQEDGDILFTCGDPLKRATAGGAHILDIITGILEKDTVARDFDRSELQEILAAHASSADGTLAVRWIELCRKSLGKKGPEALHAINEGSLIIALTGVPMPDERVSGFLRNLLHQVETAPPAIRDDVQGLHSYHAVKKAVTKG